MYPMTYTGKSGQQYGDQWSAEEDFLAPMTLRRTGVGATPSRAGATAVPTGAGGYGTDGFVDPTQQWAAAENARRRQAEAQRVSTQSRIDAGTRANEEYRQQEDAANRARSAAIRGQSYGASAANLELVRGGADRRRYEEQETTRANQEARARTAYIQRVLAGMRTGGEMPTVAAQAGGWQLGAQLNERDRAWQLAALDAWDDEQAQAKGDTETFRRRQVSDLEIAPDDADFTKALGGSGEEWDQYAKRSRRLKQLGDVALPEYYKSRLGTMSDADFAAVTRAYRPASRGY